MSLPRLLAVPLFFFALAAPAAEKQPTEIVDRARAQVGNFIKLFSEVRCTEEVSQFKLTKRGKVEHQQRSVYDYLVIAQDSGSDLSLQESRLEQQGAAKKTDVPMLVTNGFATLLLVFHPSYQDSFDFSPPEMEAANGRTLAKVRFRHRPNKPSTTELVLRGREYPLDLAGTAWIDPESGSIVRIEAGLAQSMDDIGLRVLRTDVEYAPVALRGVDATLRLPSVAKVEVETARQHWRNVHRFRGYQHFDVSVEETVKAKP